MIDLEVPFITTVIFDYGRVLSCDQDQGHFTEMARFAGVAPEDLRGAYFELRSEYDRGVWSGEEYWSRILDRCSVEKDDKKIRRLIALDIASWTNINASMIDFIKDIKDANTTVAIISNMPHDIKEYVISEFDWFTLVDKAFFSCDYQSNKPETFLFEECLQTVGAKPENCLFIDDLESNVASAKALGMHGHVFTDVNDLYDALINYEGISALSEL